MKNVHKYHRHRLRKKYISKGTEFFEKHELLELLLFYALSQKNTNLVGHDLIKRFGSIAAVFDATRTELKEVYDIGERTAEFIKFIGDVVAEYSLRSAQRSGVKFGQAEGMRFARRLFSDNPSESRLYMIMLGPHDSIISVDLLAKGDYTYESVSMRDIVFRAINLDVLRVILVHNHINGSLLPSDADIRFTRNVEMAFSYIDVEVNDHIIVAGGTAVSICNDMLKKSLTMV